MIIGGQATDKSEQHSVSPAPDSVSPVADVVGPTRRHPVDLLPHVVYIVRGHDGQILYVGCTSNLKRRSQQHRRAKRYRGELASIEVESTHPDYWSGRKRESELIWDHEPPHNTYGNPAWTREKDAWDRIATAYGIWRAGELTHGRTAADALLAIRDTALATAMRRAERAAA